MIGIIKRIKDGGFFGFIEANGSDYFLHKDDFEGSWGELHRAVKDGKRVHIEFTPIHTNKGERATEAKWVEPIL